MIMPPDMGVFPYLFSVFHLTFVLRIPETKRRKQKGIFTPKIGSRASWQLLAAGSSVGLGFISTSRFWGVECGVQAGAAVMVS
jgi:hypothetical protein